MIIIEACYVVEYVYPNTGGVYAATTLAGGFSTAWYACRLILDIIVCNLLTKTIGIL